MNENPYASPKSVEEETKKSFSALDVAYNLVVWTSPTFFFGLVVIQLCYEQSAMPWSVRVPNEWLFAAIWLVSQMAVLILFGFHCRDVYRKRKTEGHNARRL